MSRNPVRLHPAAILLLAAAALAPLPLRAQEPSGEASAPEPAPPQAARAAETNPTGGFDVDLSSIFRLGMDRTEAVRVTDAISQAVGFGNTFMVTTSEGNVIIDTSLPLHAPRHRKLLTAVSAAPVKYIILTHAHADHTGGVKLWKQEGTEVIAQENHTEFIHYQDRLGPFFHGRNEAQFAFKIPAGFGGAGQGNYGGEVLATILFDEDYAFELGGTRFELFHTPGETYDHLSVWIPSMKAVFVGDNFYDSFPNLYTLRGTKPRWALDYVESINRILQLEPELLLPSHGDPVYGKAEIARRLTQYRDAVLFVHDATVKGMNEGKDVFTLMREIRLPGELNVGEAYGAVSWSVRGIYEGYAGWFDGNPATMYAESPAVAYPPLVELAGGAGRVAARAQELLSAGQVLQALHLADIALTAEPRQPGALAVRIAALERLLELSANINERGWLKSALAETRALQNQP